MKVNTDQFNYWQLRDLQAEQENQDEATDKLKIINSAYQQAQTYLSDEVKRSIVAIFMQTFQLMKSKVLCHRIYRRLN